jgi:hypothetical protein
MANQPDIDAICALMRTLGFTVDEVRTCPEAFGSWFIHAQAQGKTIRVV